MSISGDVSSGIQRRNEGEAATMAPTESIKQQGRRTGVIALVLAVTGTMLWGASQAQASTIFTPAADSFIDAGQPNGNFGSATYMRADASPVRRAFLRFDVSSVGPQSSATLKLFVESSSSEGLELFAVNDNGWSERTITHQNAPAVGAPLDTSGTLASGQWYSFDVSAFVTGDGTYSFALTTTDNTAIRIASRESANDPQLLVPAPPNASPYAVSNLGGGTYLAASATAGTTFTGSLKSVVESAVTDLDSTGGGEVLFDAGVFDLGSTNLEFYDVFDITFAGQGIDVTTLRNVSSAAKDTEPFDFTGALRVTIRDMTISAGGPVRTTSDAIDFDAGNDSIVARVKITASRARGIVFDGKGAGWTADGNEVHDCVIAGVTLGDGIELLASRNNLIEGCTITDVGGHGIQVNKSSLSADQPDKKSSDNVVTGNVITDAGQDGINVISGDRNQLLGNTILNSSDNTSGRDGIRIQSGDSQTCDDNVVDGNIAGDNQAAKTQRYGLNIASSLCKRTVVTGNDFSGNLIAPIRDVGTGTIYGLDTEDPTAPTNVVGTPVSSSRVDLTWTASTDDVGVTKYRVFRDGAQVGTSAVTSFSDLTVLASTTYSYEIQAADAADNVSALSAPPVSVTTPAPSMSATFTPEADAHVDSATPDGNFGTASTVRVDASPIKRTYLRFSVQGVPGAVTSATLRLYATSSSSVGHDVASSSDVTWGERTITYSNAPGFGASVGSSGPFSSGNWIEVDVTSIVAGEGLVSFVVTTPSNTAISYGSREGANDPQLVVEWA
jgi:parallel beta-helix repeat protein